MPPLTLENASALVPGGGFARDKETGMIAQKPAQMPQTAKVEVLRAFYYKGEVLAVKSTPTLPRVFALEMAAANKVRIVEEEPAKAEPQASQPAADEATNGKQGKKETRNAR